VPNQSIHGFEHDHANVGVACAAVARTTVIARSLAVLVNEACPWRVLVSDRSLATIRMWAGLNHRTQGFVQASLQYDWQFATDSIRGRGVRFSAERRPWSSPV
jgi:hypothetical protein